MPWAFPIFLTVNTHLFTPILNVKKLGLKELAPTTLLIGGREDARSGLSDPEAWYTILPLSSQPQMEASESGTKHFYPLLDLTTNDKDSR